MELMASTMRTPLFLYLLVTLCSWCPSSAFLLAPKLVANRVFFAQESSESGVTTEPEKTHQLCIEYCTGCRWGLKGFWLAQELLSTFSNEHKLTAVTLVPSRPSNSNPPATFRVQISTASESPQLLWDRHKQGGFPEAKDLKRLVRDVINPQLFLGHSDTNEKQEKQQQTETSKGPEVIDFNQDVPDREDTTPTTIDHIVPPHVAITYCTGCRWLLRAAYLAQELTTTFAEELNSLTLIPSRPPAKGGAFVVTATLSKDGPETVLWDRTVQGRFPEAKELKQKVRDLINPEKDLGHSEPLPTKKTLADDMSDDEAEEARNFFGVA